MSQLQKSMPPLCCSSCTMSQYLLHLTPTHSMFIVHCGWPLILLMLCLLCIIGKKRCHWFFFDFSNVILQLYIVPYLCFLRYFDSDWTLDALYFAYRCSCWLNAFLILKSSWIWHLEQLILTKPLALLHITRKFQ